MLPSMHIHTTPDDIKYLLFNQSEVISDVIRNNGVWNPGIQDITDLILSKIYEHGKVIDIGAGIGTFCIPLALKHYGKFDFFVYEPQRVINMQLAANILLNGLDNFRVFNYVIGMSNGLRGGTELEIERSNNHGSHSFNELANRLRGMVTNTDLRIIPYEMKTLDSFDFKDVRFIKISAPGMEADVLNGAINTIINNDKPPVLIECWSADWYAEQRAGVQQVFKDLGYEHYIDMGEHLFAFKSIAQYNYFMLETEVKEELGEFKVAEQYHNAEDTIAAQKPKM